MIVPQHAWVQSGSIRQNITFSTGQENAERLRQIVDACCLRDDLATLPDGIK